LNDPNDTKVESEPDSSHYLKGMNTKGHPLVPKLDFDKICIWREQQELEDAQDSEYTQENYADEDEFHSE
jgi:hypothetical protein